MKTCICDIKLDNRKQDFLDNRKLMEHPPTELQRVSKPKPE